MKNSRHEALHAGSLARYSASAILLFGALFIATQASAEIPLANKPLSMTAVHGAKPNVVLMMDNSGSMQNIMWYSDPTYDPMKTNTIDYNKYFDYNHEYPHWMPASNGNGGGGNQRQLTATTDPYGVYDKPKLKDLPRNGNMICANNPVDQSAHCLTLPDPARSSQGTSGNGDTTYVKNYLNFLFEYAYLNNLFDVTSGNYDYTSATSPIPQETRMGAARRIMKEIVGDSKNDNIRFGLFEFNGSNGASLLQECDAPHANTVASIEGMYGHTSTPLSEAYYDIVSYFRGQYSSGSTSYSSPIEYRCQQNVAIVITDGYPTSDTGLSNVTYTGGPYTNKSVQNWDGLAPTTTSSDFPINIPPFSDGFGGSGEGGSLFLDDLAKFGFDIDLVPVSSRPTDGDGMSFDDTTYGRPAYNATVGPDLRAGHTTVTYPAVTANPGAQYLTAHTIGLATANQMLVDAAYYTRGTYASVDSADQLRAALADALSKVITTADIKSVTSVSVSSGIYINNETNYLYDVSYDSSSWTGQVTAIPINYDTVSQTLSLGTSQSFSIPSNPSARVIKTLNANGAVIDFNTAHAADLVAIGDNSTVVPSDTLNNRIDYLRGDNTLETDKSGGIYRVRAGLQYDIVNSAVVFAGHESNYYPDALESASYSEFLSTRKSNRTPMIYVGSNGGGIQAFDAETGGSFSEKLAFIPPALLGKMSKLTDPAYQHEYFADATPVTRDVFYDNAWHSVLSGGLGKGAQAVYGLDITDPSSFGQSWGTNSGDAWQFSDADDADMGYVYTQPALVKMPSGHWAAVFPNGYNSDSSDGSAGPGKAVVYIRYFDGTATKKIDTSAVSTSSNAHASNNGMAAVTPIDLNGDDKVDYLYATDIQGNLWKISLDSNDSAQVSLLFSTCGNSANCTQPITSFPTVGVGAVPDSVLVYFGTGKYLGDGDTTNTDTQSFYAIMDIPTDSSYSVSQSDLQAQTIVAQSSSLSHDSVGSNGQTVTTPLDGTYRIVSSTPVTYYSTDPSKRKKGWKLDLSFNGAQTGERVISPAMLRNGKVIFTTNFYTSSNTFKTNNNGQPMVCDDGNISVDGGGWKMVLDAINGSPYHFSSFDTTGDNIIDDTDKATYGNGDVAVSGKLVDNANVSSATLITTANGIDSLLLKTSSGITIDKASDKREALTDIGNSWTQY